MASLARLRQVIVVDRCGSLGADVVDAEIAVDAEGRLIGDGCRLRAGQPRGIPWYGEPSAFHRS